MADVVHDYLRENNTFYSRFWKEHPLYGTPFPNAEEAERAAVILRTVSSLFETGAIEASTARILDLGCGRGWLTRLLSVYGRCEGCEPTAEAVDMSRQFFPDLVFHVGTLSDLMQSRTFRPYHLIVTSEVLEHVPRSLKPSFVRDIYTALVPAGFVILTTPRRELWRHCGGSSEQLIEDWLTEGEVRALFDTAGFETVMHERSYPTHSARVDRVFARCRRWLERMGIRAASLTLQKALDFRSSLYQIWCFRKK